MPPTIDMPKFTLDFGERLFIAKAGVTDVDVQLDLYSDWKEAILASDELGQAPALRSVGGDPISDTQNLGATFFLINGYRIRPQEADHELEIVGNIYSDPAGSAIVVPTLGTFTVLVTNRVSNLVDSSVARLDLNELLQAVYIDADLGNDANNGTPTSPVATVAAARTLADAANLRAYVFRGAVTLNGNHPGWTFSGASAESNDIVNLAGYDVDAARFDSCVLAGAMTGVIEAENCGIAIVTNLAGVLRDCGLSDDTMLAAGSDTVFATCFSEIAGGATPKVTLGAGSSCHFRNYSGGLELDGLVDPGNVVSVDLDPGRLVLGSGNTGGQVLVRGTGTLDDSSAGTAVDKSGLISAVDINLIRAMVAGNAVVSPDDLTVTVYDDDDVTVLATFAVSVDGRTRTRTG